MKDHTTDKDHMAAATGKDHTVAMEKVHTTEKEHIVGLTIHKGHIAAIAKGPISAVTVQN